MARPFVIALAVGCLVESAAVGQNGLAVTAAKATFPIATFACRPFKLPIQQDAAKTAIADAQDAWINAAVAAPVNKSTALFVDAVVEPVSAESSQTELDARMCAIVSAGTKADGFVIETSPTVLGKAGFCAQTDVDVCLAEAAVAAGYTSEHPWPRLPIYARWPAGTLAPVKADQVVAHLATSMLPIPQLATAAIQTRERSSGGLRPLVLCEKDGCPRPPTPESRAVTGPGIGWFIRDPLPAGSK